jgi:hypothetical protein
MICMFYFVFWANEHSNHQDIFNLPNKIIGNLNHALRRQLSSIPRITRPLPYITKPPSHFTSSQQLIPLAPKKTEYPYLRGHPHKLPPLLLRSSHHLCLPLLLSRISQEERRTSLPPCYDHEHGLSLLSGYPLQVLRASWWDFYLPHLLHSLSVAQKNQEGDWLSWSYLQFFGILGPGICLRLLWCHSDDRWVDSSCDSWYWCCFLLHFVVHHLDVDHYSRKGHA